MRQSLSLREALTQKQLAFLILPISSQNVKHSQRMPIQLREAHLNDGPGLSRLLDQLGYAGTEAFVEERIRALSSDPNSGILVCVAEQQLLGFLAYHLFAQIGLAGDFCRITYFCVDEHCRGQGVGEALEEAVTELAQRRGCDRIEVHCSSYRVKAHGFYAKQGYQESPKYLTKTLQPSSSTFPS